MRTKRRYGKYLLIYTAAFTVIFLCVFSPYLLQGKNLIGKGDGQSQYILHLRYMGEWLRETFRGFVRGDFHPDRFDLTIGIGDDIDAVVRFHPLDFLSAFVPGAYTEYLYSALTVLRCYLAGLALSAYAFHFKKSGTAALSGALVYVFSGFTFGLGVVHPTYMSHMILLPLIFLGAEYMMDPERKKSSLLFTVTIALGFISNYYFMYISSFGLLAYVLIRFFAIYKEKRLRNFFRLLFSMVFAYLTGLCISAVFLLPALMRYAGSMRGDHAAERNSLLVYADKRRYLAWFLNSITPLEASGNGTHLNYSVVLLPAVVLTFFSKRRRKFSSQMRPGLLILLVSLLVPGIGYVLAAMNNENNRWVYLIAFAAAVTVAFTADMVLSMTKRERFLVAGTVLVFDLGCAVWYVISRGSVYHAAAALMVTVYSAVILLLSRRVEKEQKGDDPVGRILSRAKQQDRRERYRGRDARKDVSFAEGVLSERLVLAFTALTVAIAGYMTFAPRFGNLVRYYQEQGTAFSRYEQSDYAVYTDAPLYSETPGQPFAKGFYRVDGIRTEAWEDNSSLLLRYPGIQIYNSIVNADQLRYMIAEQNIGLTSILHIHSLDGRTAAEELAGVRYFAIDGGNRASLPYGYSLTPVAARGNYVLYENEHPLPFGFMTSQVLARSDFDRLSPSAGEQAMLSSVVLEDEDAEDMAGLARTDGQDIQASILEEEAVFAPDANLAPSDGGYTAGQEDGVLTASFTGKAGYECCLSLKGLKLLSGSDLSGYVYVTAPGVDRKILLSAADNTYTRGRDDYLVCLGHPDAGAAPAPAVLQIRVPAGLKIALTGASFVYTPLSGYEDKIAALSEKSLQDLQWSGDKITGSISLDQPACLVMQIPYGKTWTAAVNGEKVTPAKADLCYIGLFLDAGRSEVTLTYHTPGLFAGRLLSCLGLVLLIVLYAADKRRSRGSV